MLTTYCIAWFGMLLLAIANGGLRDLAYQSRLGERAAHQLSTLILLLLFTGYLWLLTRHWPIESAKQAWLIGGIWCLLTALFEVGLARLGGHSWQRIRHAYNLLAGELWGLIPLWLLIAPYLFFRYQQGR